MHQVMPEHIQMIRMQRPIAELPGALNVRDLNLLSYMLSLSLSYCGHLSERSTTLIAVPPKNKHRQQQEEKVMDCICKSVSPLQLLLVHTSLVALPFVSPGALNPTEGGVAKAARARKSPTAGVHTTQQHFPLQHTFTSTCHHTPVTTSYSACPDCHLSCFCPRLQLTGGAGMPAQGGRGGWREGREAQACPPHHVDAP